MHKILIAMLMSTMVLGCKKGANDGAAKDDKAVEGAGGAKAAAATPLTADPDPGAITAGATAPFESVKFRMLDKRDAAGWPQFDAYDLNTKPIKFLAITAYAYDKDGKQVARTAVPLSLNDTLPPGDKSSWPVEVGTPADAVPASATTYQLCYSSIKFDGDAAPTADDARCPAQRPKK